VQRERLPDLVYNTGEDKWLAIVDEIRELHGQGRPILVGTRSIDKSVILSKLLIQAGIEHKILNAHEIAAEAEIVARAGQPGKVTVATNMAGRGTDIKLGPGVAEAGGLQVIGTERHEAERIDRQLVGRAGRQGDPGRAEFMVSLEDQLLEGLGTARRGA